MKYLLRIPSTFLYVRIYVFQIILLSLYFKKLRKLIKIAPEQRNEKKNISFLRVDCDCRVYRRHILVPMCHDCLLYSYEKKYRLIYENIIRNTINLDQYKQLNQITNFNVILGITVRIPFVYRGNVMDNQLQWMILSPIGSSRCTKLITGVCNPSVQTSQA